MVGRTRAVVTRAEERPRESWGDPARGAVSWFTLISGDITPTSGMTAGIAEIPVGSGPSGAHHHEQAELYYVIEGRGTLTIDGAETAVAAGSTAFIPGNAEHSLRNDGETVLKLLYVFPTDRFADVVYRFPG